MSSTDTPTPKYSIHDFMVDFLGGLVPGSMFIVGICMAILPAIYLFFCFIANTKTASITTYMNNVLKTTRNTPNMIWVLAFALFIAISYELGHLFFRKDPKVPDIESFKKLKRNDEKRYDGKHREKLIKHLKSEYGCTDENDCQFPYVDLRDYLGKRGHCHLCPFVVWKGKTEEFNRSKTFINLLKIRLKHYFPEKCSIIIRNEAHIRLATSSWYVAQSLRVWSLIGLFLVLLLIFLNKYSISPTDPFKHYLAFMVPAIFVFISSVFMVSRVEDFLHYQRLREIFYVIETAFTAFRQKPVLLNPPFERFSADFNRGKCKDTSCDYHPENLKSRR